MKFNVRLALPPDGINCDAGIGSTYIFNLKPGDRVKAGGPFGEFHITDSAKEMVYLGGGAGMAPIRSHLSWLFESVHTDRKISYWYGARTVSDLYYHDYFSDLASRMKNFSFHVALSDTDEVNQVEFHLGLIHEVFEREFISRQENVTDKEYYLCGPPAMIVAVRELLTRYHVPQELIRFDEF